jgi:Phage integrase, N-terminal SAM-like domain
MTSHPSHRPVSALRARMIEDMRVRGFTEKTRNDYVRNVRAFAAFIGRSPDTATAEDLRCFQLYQTQTGMQPPSINSAVAALRFFFAVTLDRPDLTRRRRGQNRDTMTPVTALSHCPPAGEPRFRRRTAVASAPPKARATRSIKPKSPRRPLPRRQTRHRDRRSTANYTGQRIPHPTSRPVKSP